MNDQKLRVDAIELEQNFYNETVLSLKRSRSAYIGHITKLINKINEGIENSENFLTIKCLREQLLVMLDKLKITINKFISVVEDPVEIEHANEIHSEQTTRFIEISQKIENYLADQSDVTQTVPNIPQIYLTRSRKTSVSSEISKKTKSSSSSSSKSQKTHSSHSSNNSLKQKLKLTRAELVLNQRKEEYNRKQELLEKQRAIKLEIEKEKLIDAENKLKLAQLNEQFENEFTLENKEKQYTFTFDNQEKSNLSFPVNAFYAFENKTFKYDTNPVLNFEYKYPNVYKSIPVDNHDQSHSTSIKPNEENVNNLELN